MTDSPTPDDQRDETAGGTGSPTPVTPEARVGEPAQDREAGPAAPAAAAQPALPPMPQPGPAHYPPAPQARKRSMTPLTLILAAVLLAVVAFGGGVWTGRATAPHSGSSWSVTDHRPGPNGPAVPDAPAGDAPNLDAPPAPPEHTKPSRAPRAPSASPSADASDSPS
jgi:hypothetical protein